MTKSEQLNYATRDLILGSLSDDEVARVSKVETAAKLSEGEEFIDLEQLHLGVQRADGAILIMGRVLSRKAVLEVTWSRILAELANAGFPHRPAHA